MSATHCGVAMIGVQYALTPEDYDGVSEWVCETCGYRQGRWSGRALAEGEIERRYGGTPRVLTDAEKEGV